MSCEHKNILWNNEYQELFWNDTPFSYPDLVRIRTIGDGSCFFHALIKAFFVPYKIGKLNGGIFSREKFITQLRKNLSVLLGQRINSKDPNSPRHYDLLSRGKLGEISRELQQYSLENMQKELDSKSPIDNIYNEFISNILNKDIYLLDLVSRDVYVTGNDSDILYKNRDSIIILTMPGHYELIGLKTPKGIQTLFPYDSPLIKSIRKRIDEKITIGSRYK